MLKICLFVVQVASLHFRLRGCPELDSSDSLPTRLFTQDLDDSITDFFGCRLSTEVSGAKAKSTRLRAVKSLANRSLDRRCRLFEAQRVPEQHGCAEDGANRIGDTLASNVGSGSVDGLVQSRRGGEAGGGGVGGGTCEGGRRKETEGSGDDARLVGKAAMGEIRSMRLCKKEMAHMSPNKFSVKMTPFNFRGFATITMAAESTRW